MEQRRNGLAVPVLNEGVAIDIVAADDSLYNLVIGDVFRLTLTGSTSPTIGWAAKGVYKVEP